MSNALGRASIKLLPWVSISFICGCTASHDPQDLTLTQIALVDIASQSDFPPANTGILTVIGPDGGAMTSQFPITPANTANFPEVKLKHQTALKVYFSSRSNISAIGHKYGDMVAVEAFACNPEEKISIMPLSGVMWRGHGVPGAAATKAIDEQGAVSSPYYLYLPVSEPAQQTSYGTLPGFSMFRSSPDICVDLSSQTSWGDSFQSNVLVVPASMIKQLNDKFGAEPRS